MNNKQDDGQFTTRSVPFIHKLIELPKKEDQSWACPSAVPYGHVLVKAYCLRDKEDGRCVVITCLYHLANFPRFVNIGWGVSVIEPKFTSDGVKAEFRHESPKAIGAWISLCDLESRFKITYEP